MDDSILLQTKFLIPKRGSYHLTRSSLVSQICDAKDNRYVFLIAPAGYGKTSILIDVVHLGTEPVTWIQLDDGDNDPATFMAYLVEGVRQQFDDLSSLTALQSENSITPDRMMIILLNQLLEYPDQKWMLILDDYHVIHNPAVHKLVTTFLDNLPTTIRVIISSRITPVLPLARWRTTNQLLEIRANALRFTYNETETWLQLQSLQLADEAIDQLVKKTEGWGAGLQLATALFDKQTVNTSIIDQLSGTQPYIFDYLMEEVFTRQSADIQSFLLRSSVFTQLSPEICHDVLEIEFAQDILDQLEKNSLFIIRLHIEQRWYRYHELFREFLLNRLKTKYRDHFEITHNKAGDYFAQQRENETAFYHYLNAQQEQKAVEVILHFAEDYLLQGRVEELRSYLHSISLDGRNSSPKLKLIQARLLRHNGQLSTAIEQLNTIIDQYENHEILSATYTELSAIRQSQGQYQQAYEMANKAVEIGEQLDVCEYVPALMQLARCIGFIKGMDIGYQLAQQAYNLMSAHSHRFGDYDRARLLHMLGQICWWHGDVHSAIIYCHSGLKLTNDKSDTPLKARLLITLSIPTLYQKDYVTALQLAEEAISICQELQLKETLPAAYSALGNVLTRTGELQRAESCLRTAIEQALSIGGARYSQVMAAGYLAQNLALQGRLDEAQSVTQSALTTYESQTTVYDVYVCRSVLADLLLEAEELQQAKTIFSNLVSIGETTQYRIPLAMVYFGLAYIFMKEQKHNQAIHYSQQSLKLLEPAMMHQLYLDQRNRALELCQQLVQHMPNNNFIKQVYHALQQSTPYLTRPQITILSSDLIKINTLGGLRVLRNNQEIQPKAFTSSKARDLLSYFVTLRSKSVSLDRAVEALWEDGSGSMSAFHTALYRLRVALRRKGDKDKFILSEVGEYRLDIAKFDIDIDHFDNLLRRAQREIEVSEKIQLFEQALALYQGDYLDNLHFEWLILERERLERDYLQGIDNLSQLLIGKKEYQSASQWQYKALEVDPYNEALHVSYMDTISHLGNQQRLIDHYDHLKKLLSDAFNAPPLPETQQRFNQLIKQI